MATAQELIDLSSELTDVVKAINAIVGQQHLPYDADTTNLSNFAFQVSAQANAIGQSGLAQLANDVQGAIVDLTSQVNAAHEALAQIADVKKALNIVGALLTAAGSIATDIATGNIGGTAGAIAKLAGNIKSALDANQPEPEVAAGAADG